MATRSSREISSVGNHLALGSEAKRILKPHGYRVETLAPRISGGDSNPRISGGDSSPTDVGWRLATRMSGGD
ncbi:hypothetical protein RRG08_033214 [Elysia crispata]|uniref:Uncharacterized protein n=1 Tax=Elysia crispata TaxID=231223 RepID=A0AAE1BB60_9GAST|nr:hypothetical protein RRG08_033214 [Elysia crispata]